MIGQIKVYRSDDTTAGLAEYVALLHLASHNGKVSLVTYHLGSDPDSVREAAEDFWKKQEAKYAPKVDARTVEGRKLDKLVAELEKRFL